MYIVKRRWKQNLLEIFISLLDDKKYYDIMKNRNTIY